MFRPRTGLPVGVFDDVLDTLGPIRLRAGDVATSSAAAEFSVDETVRAAHFVCSRDDAATITALAGVSDCLLVNSKQFDICLVDIAATLSALTISAGTLDPVFAAATTSYTVTVPNRVNAVTVTPTAARTGASITVNTRPVNSGSASAVIPLTAGTPEDIAIAVTAADRVTTKTYTVTVTRASAPSITGIGLTSNAVDGVYAIGEAIEATVTFSEAVTITDQPQLALTVGTATRQAVYASGSSTTTALVFSYTVAADDHDTDGVSIDTNALTLAGSSTIRNAADTADALITHSVTVAGTLEHTVDGLVPTVVGVAISSTGPYTESEAIALTVTFSEAVTVVGTPQLPLTVGNATRQAAYTGGSGSSALIFSYTVVAGDRDEDGVEVARNALMANNGTIRDAAGNAALLDHAAIAADATNRVDTAAPTVSTATINGAALTLTYNEALDASSVPAPAAWTLTLGSGPAPTVNVGGVTINGAGVTLALNTAVVSSDVVTLAYTAGANPLRDLAGNNAADLTTQAVINNTPPPPGAALSGTLTEAGLFAPTPPTVTVTLTNTAYATELLSSHFTPTDTVDGAVTVTDVTRDDDTTATLTLAYDNVDITTDGTLSVTAAAAAHTGIGDLPTGTIPISASAGINICGRTPQVRDTLLATIRPRPSDCTNVPATGLRSVIFLNLSGQDIPALQRGDFAGLSGMATLRLNSNPFTTLPAGIFTGLTALERLFLNATELATLPVGIFNGLTSLRALLLHRNHFTTLPAAIFNGLDALVVLTLDRNPDFTPGTGLPVGIFDDVLDTLGAIRTTGFTGLRVDDTVRAAHFVCSRPDADAIVAFAGVNDCLWVNSAQFNAYLNTRLSALTISAGTLDPVFAAATTTYIVTVPNRVDAVTVTPTVARTASSITVNTNPVDSGSASTAIPLTAGTPKDIAIVVTAADRVATQTYTVTVTRAPAPSITGIGLTSDAGDGVYAIGEAIEATVTFSEAVTVTDRPQLALIVGTVMRQAVYASGSSTTTALVFSYTVAADDHDTDGVSIDTNALALAGSSTIRNAADTADALITHSVTVAGTLEHTVDGLVPTVVGVAISSTGPYTESDAIALTVTFSEAVTVVGTPQLPLTVGNAVRQAAYTGGSGSLMLMFSYTVVAGDRDEDGVEVARNALTANNGTIRDAAGNAALLDHAAIAADATNRVDTAAPTVSTATINGAALTLTYNEALDASSVPAPAAWTLTLGSGPAPTVNTGGVTINGTTVTLALNTAVVSSDVVTLAYTAGANPLRDLAGNNAADLTTQAVINNTPPPPGAALSGTLTEAGLFAPTPPTVTVTLTNTAYVTELLSSHFTPTDTVAGAVTVTDVTRDNAITATLTLAYDNVDITTDGTLFVTVAAAAHTGIGDLPTGTIPISASTGVNICDRTPQVRDAILRAIRARDCANLSTTRLQSVTGLNLHDQNISALKSGDFADLSGMAWLALSANQLATLPPGIFDGLTALMNLFLRDNRLDSLPPGIFDGLSKLTQLELHRNPLSALSPDIFDDLTALTRLALHNTLLDTLPSDIFDGLTALTRLDLNDNDFVTLPAGIFGGLTTLRELYLSGNQLNKLPVDIFAGLTALVELGLARNDFDTLPLGIFAGLTALERLFLSNNGFTTLPASIFAGLTSLERLFLQDNELARLPRIIFKGLSRLAILHLRNNLFRPRTGLPIGVFDDVLDTLGPIVATSSVAAEFSVDEIVRAAHFVCSRDDADAITALAGVSDCLLVSSAQFNAYLAQHGATLSALTVSPGTLDPVFAPDTADYTVTIPNGVTSVTVTPTAARSDAAVTVGTASVTPAIIVLPPLTPGEALTIPIVVTTAAGITATYRLALTYAPERSIDTNTNTALTAEAGDDQFVFPNTLVTLAGTGSDPDDTDGQAALTYRWTQTGGTPSVALTGADTATATFTVPALTTDTILTFTLTVTDALGAESTDTTIVAIQSTGDWAYTLVNTAPTPARATAAQTRGSGDELAARSVGDPTALATIAANNAPVAVGSIENREIIVGEAATVDVATHFSDPDTDDSLTWQATATDETIATASVDGSVVTISAVSAGSTTITVTASDTGGLTALQAFTVDTLLLCPAPTAPPNGAVVTTGTAVGDEATYSCAVSFMLAGSALATCTAADDGMTARFIPAAPECESAAGLTALSISSGELSPAFAFERQSYAVSVVRQVAHLTVTPTMSDGGARIMVAGNPVASGTASNEIALAFGENRIEVEVMTANNSPNRMYTLRVMRADGALQTEQLNKQILPRVFSTLADVGNRLIAERLSAGAGTTGGSPQDSSAGSLSGMSMMDQLGQWVSSDAGELELSRRLQNLDTFELSDLIDGLSFDADGERVGMAGVALHGIGNYSRLSGDEDGINWDGDLYSGYVGLDKRLRDDVLAGVLLSYSKGEFEYTDAAIEGDGQYDLNVSSAHPYLGWSLSDDLELWARVGYGVGEVELTDSHGQRSSDLTVGSASVGANGRLYASDTLIAGGHSELRLRGDASVSQVDFDLSNAGFKDVSSHRARLILEASHTRSIESGSLRSGLELGVRHDGGDSQDDQGLELGGSVEWSNTCGLTLSGQGRVLTLADYDEWGLSGALRLAPGQGGRGLSFSLSPSYGRDGSGIEELWQQGASAVSSTEQTAQLRMDGEVGYGIWSMGGTVRPYLGASLLEGGGRTQRLGASFELGRGVKMELKGSRRERTNANADYRIELQWNWSW